MNSKTLAAIAVMASLSINTPAFAVTQLANSAQKGSLLIFPRIEALAPSNGAPGFSDTLINITNDSPKAVMLQCYWGTTEQHATRLGGNAVPTQAAKAARAALRNNHYMGFSLTLSKNQPAAFWAGDLSEMANKLQPGFNILTTTENTPQFNNFQDGSQAKAGELRCWAISNNGFQEIHHNHLIGKATIFTFKPDSTAISPTAASQAHEYTAWAFQAHYQGSSNAIYTGKPLPTPGQLNLDGTEYDRCPSALIGQFIPTGRVLGGEKTRTQISIASCHEDLTLDGNARISNLNYSVYNSNGIKYTGAHECMGAWYEADLGVAFPHFTYRTLKSDSALFLVRPTASRQCNQGLQSAAMEKDIAASSIVGVQINDVGGHYQTSSNLIGLGGSSDAPNIAPAGKILWEPSYDLRKKILKSAAAVVIR
jgi:hypothetical protein